MCQSDQDELLCGPVGHRRSQQTPSPPPFSSGRLLWGSNSALWVQRHRKNSWIKNSRVYSRVLFSQLSVSTHHHEHSKCNGDSEIPNVGIVFVIRNRTLAVGDYLTCSVKSVFVLYLNICHSDDCKQTPVTQTVADLSYSFLSGLNACVKHDLKDE